MVVVNVIVIVKQVGKILEDIAVQQARVQAKRGTRTAQIATMFYTLDIQV